MALICSISGVRGTIGGQSDNLSPAEIVKWSSAFGAFVLSRFKHAQVAVGQDGRASGAYIRRLVCATLEAMGIRIRDLALTTTPTLAFYVGRHMQGGIMVSASHNPSDWNALKFFYADGVFFSHTHMEELLSLAQAEQFTYASTEQIGNHTEESSALDEHLDAICALPLVNRRAIQKQEFRLVVDGINSGGAIAVKHLLERLGAEQIDILNADIDKDFTHPPEPLEENLTQISSHIRQKPGSIGVVVDPDVDRLCLICEDGSFFGEEYSLVAVADFVLGHHRGAVVNNVLSSRVLEEVARRHGCRVYSAKVGEINVIAKMKEHAAVIGGEGSGGIIYPALHYSRDALVGIALILSFLAQENVSLTQLRNRYPSSHMVKEKIQLNCPHTEWITRVEQHLRRLHPQAVFTYADGVKLQFADRWLCLRPSNTEPLVRIYAEAPKKEEAQTLVDDVLQIRPDA